MMIKTSYSKFENMKKFLLKNKWLISIGIFSIFILIGLLILIKTNSIDIFYDRVNNKIRSISIISIIILLIGFIADIVKGWISNYVTDFIFPSAQKKILENTNDIKNKTDIILSKVNKDLKPYNKIWNALNELRYYYDKGMQKDIQKYGTLKLIPIFELREIVSKSKMNIDVELYNKLELLNSVIAKKTNENIFEPMKLFLKNKSNLFPNEIKKIELEINNSRIEILKLIEKFMLNNKEQFKQ